jgi:hypothetical protein
VLPFLFMHGFDFLAGAFNGGHPLHPKHASKKKKEGKMENPA